MSAVGRTWISERGTGKVRSRAFSRLLRCTTARRLSTPTGPSPSNGFDLALVTRSRRRLWIIRLPLRNRQALWVTALRLLGSWLPAGYLDTLAVRYCLEPGYRQYSTCPGRHHGVQPPGRAQCFPSGTVSPLGDWAHDSPAASPREMRTWSVRTRRVHSRYLASPALRQWLMLAGNPAGERIAWQS